MEESNDIIFVGQIQNSINEHKGCARHGCFVHTFHAARVPFY